MRTVVCLVGAAYLGEAADSKQSALPDAIARLEALDDTEVALEMLTTTREGPGHRQPVLARLLQVLDHHGWNTPETELVFVGTRQHPSHVGDTHRIASLAERAIPHAVILGAGVAEFSTSSIEISSLVAKEVAESVGQRISASAQLAVVLGPGATGAQMGCIMACLLSGCAPSLIELNGPDDIVPEPIALQTEANLVQSLASRAQYHAAGVVTRDKTQKAALETLAAASELNWFSAYDRAQPYKKMLTMLSNLKKMRFGNAPVEDAIEWTRFAARTHAHRHDRIAHAFTIRLAALELERLIDREPDLVGEMNDPCRREACGADHGDATIETLMRCPELRATASPQLAELINRFAGAWRVANRERHRRGERSLDSVSALIMPETGQWSPERVLAQVGLVGPVFAAVDDAPWDLLIVPAGKRMFSADGAGHTVIAALVEAFSPARVLMLGAEDADEALFAGGLPAGCDLRLVKASLDEITSTRRCLGHLRAHRPNTPLGRIAVLVGPGSQAMNAACLLAGVEWAFERSIDLSVFQASLAPGTHPEDAVTRLIQLDVSTGGLAPTEAVAGAMFSALNHGDLQLALSLLDQAPASWRAVLEQPIQGLLDETQMYEDTAAIVGLFKATMANRPFRTVIELHKALEIANDERRRELVVDGVRLDKLRNRLVHGPHDLNVPTDELRTAMATLDPSTRLVDELRSIQEAVEGLRCDR